jgi:hypothetical protein
LEGKERDGRWGWSAEEREMKGWERVQGIGQERRKRGKGFESGLWNAAVEGERRAISGMSEFPSGWGFL